MFGLSGSARLAHATRFPFLRLRRLAPVLAGFALAAVLVPTATAAPPAAQALNPEPPDFYTCHAVGGGTICRASTVESFELEPTGIICGSGAGTYEVLDSGTRLVRATRWYDADGNLTRRQRILDFEDTHLTNPLTGATVDYQQHNTDWDVLAVPGDLSSSTFHGHGVLSLTFPGSGVVWHSSGVAVVGPDGSLLHSGGLDALDVAELCVALGG